MSKQHFIDAALKAAICFFLAWYAPLGLAATWLTQAEQAYLEGDYQKARDLAVSHERDASALAKNEQANYFLLRARVGAVDNDAKAVRQWLERLYETKPEQSLNVYLDPPLLFHEWESVRAAKKAEREGKARAPVDPLRKEARYWVSLLPFGIGHFDRNDIKAGFGYLGLDLALAYVLIDQPKKVQANPKKAGQSVSALAGNALVGSWGYQVNDLVPALYAQDSETTETLRFWLSFAPFGVGQQKNGDTAKAFGIAVVEAGLWSLAAFGASESARELGTLGLAVAYFYGGYDGWVNHSSYAASSSRAERLRLTPLVVDVAPAKTEGPARLHYGLDVSFSF